MSIVTELIREVEGYLPDMVDFLRTVSTDTTNKHAVKELHRMSHTIKGAALMVGLNELGNTAAIMEDFLDDIVANKQSWNRQVIAFMADTVGSIGSYCTSLRNNEGDDVGELYRNTRLAFEKIDCCSSENSDKTCPSVPAREQVLFAGIEEEQDNVTSDFFPQLSTEEDSEEDSEELEDHLDILFDTDDTTTEVDTLLYMSEEDDSAQLSGIDPELQQSFNEEAEEHLENIGRHLNAFSSTVIERVAISDEYRERLHSIRRSVHTLKGAAAVIGIEPVAAWGHKFEDFLDWLHDESDILSAKIVTVMHDGTDILEEITANPNVDLVDEISGLVNTFQLIMVDISASPHKDPDNSLCQFSNNTEPADVVIDPEMLHVFSEEAEEHLENIGRQLNVLSSSVTSPVAFSNKYHARVNSIRRSVHALKDAAGVSGIRPVADWGHEFEVFLNWLHDESDNLSPDIIKVLLDFGNVLEKISVNPGKDVAGEQDKIKSVCRSIVHNSPTTYDEIISTVEKTYPLIADIDQDVQKAGEQRGNPRVLTGPKEKQQQTRKRTLRVEGEKIAEVSGLSGDMSINLSSFENVMHSMQSSLEELEMTLQRLKGIAANLEAGYELASIPYLGAMAESDQGSPGVTDEFDPLEMDRYSELHILIRSLNETVVDLDSIRGQTSDIQDSLRVGIDRQRGVVSRVQGAIQSIQMTPFSILANRLYKTVRESARATEKKVRLLIEGGSIEMDTQVWDVLADALMHMLRNSVDHGVETPDQRRQVGKTEQATIRINCSRRGSRFVLRLSDDGSGLDYNAIRQKVLTLNPQGDVEQMDDQELASQIFKQGFSIRTQVTSISGRGVGMDVVRNAVEQLNGHIEVQSNQLGTDFILSMPIVVAQLPALMVRFGGQVFAIPMRDVIRVFRLSGNKSTEDELEVDGNMLPLLRPVELLRLKDPVGSGRNVRDDEASFLAIAVETRGKRGVLLADAVICQQDVVFKSLGSHLQNIPFVSGATILGDGSLVPILQTEDLLSRKIESASTSEQVTFENDSENEHLEILVVDDSISIRKVLTSFIHGHGWHPTTAHDGVDAMERIRDNKPDLIILDIEMPRMNGFEVLQSLQMQSAYRDIPVLMLTSRNAEKYRDKAAQLGARGFVTKPFKDEELLSLINALAAEKKTKGNQG